MYNTAVLISYICVALLLSLDFMIAQNVHHFSIKSTCNSASVKIIHVNYYMCYNIAWWTSKTERMAGHVGPSNVITINVITQVIVEKK